ncbi:hypothetical protein ACHHYP_05798 [Achlya hypogyna]|uniref:BUB protein kinase n=1 Tax=Achlya hypogyna TaxID=1202772 RepID=A0A1V9YWM9_ACHHY|nr:hypothetical protein ACHHYP_05798 [Achlya hypogyna]
MATDDAAFAWELCKENVAPVARGRNVDKLNALLMKANSVELKAALAETEQTFEEKLKTYSGHDPLETWCVYQKWIEENFPSDTAKNFAILERATRAFTSDRRYRNDARYMRFWIQYIDRVDKPIDVFKFLYKNKIGDKLALFYIAWSLLLEKKGDVKNAELIYNKGLQRKAEPFAALERKHAEFERRVSQKWLNTCRPSDDDVTDEHVRPALAQQAPTIVVPVRRQPAAAKAVANNTSASSFTIYSENDRPNTGGVLSENKSSTWRKLPSAKTLNKENEQTPTVWAGAGLGPRGAVTPLAIVDEPMAPPIEIFVDDSSSRLTTGVKRPHASMDNCRALRPRLEDRFATPDVLNSNEENMGKPMTATKPTVNPAPSTKPAVKRDILRVNIDMLRVPGEHDLCFEEVRARRYFEAQAVKKAAAAAVPIAKKPVVNGFLVDQADDLSMTLPTAPKWARMPVTKSTVPPGSVVATTGGVDPLDALANDPKYTQEDMTFNTRVAYEDIHSMFCSPSKQTTPAPDQMTSFRKSTWVPQTEEPIVRKLHFSAFKQKQPHGDDDDDTTAHEQSTFQIFTEENDTKPTATSTKKNASRKALVDRNDIAHATKKTNKDVLGFSLLPTLGERTADPTDPPVTTLDLAPKPSQRYLIDPFVRSHRKELIQSPKVAALLCAMVTGVYVYKHGNNAKFPILKQKGPVKFKTPVVVTFNHLQECLFTGRLGTGSFASVYAASFTASHETELSDKEMAVKFEKAVEYLPWEFYAIQTIHNRSKPADVGLFPRLHPLVIQVDQLHVYENATFLCLQRSYRGTLHDLVSTYAKLGKTVPEPVALFYTIQMLRAANMVHAADFLHGDVKPDNWVLQSGSAQALQTTGTAFETSEVCLIDFGRAIDRRLYPSGMLFVGDCHAKGFQCVEMLTKRPWTEQVDAFGVAATAHFLLFGDYIDLRHHDGTWTIKRPWKRYWRADLWNSLFHCLLNVPSCTAQPDLTELANMLERYFVDDPAKIKELRQLLRAQDRMVPRSSI